MFKREFKSDKVLLGKLTAYFAQGQALYAGFTNKMQVRRRKGSKGGRARTHPPPPRPAPRSRASCATSRHRTTPSSTAVLSSAATFKY